MTALTLERFIQFESSSFLSKIQGDHVRLAVWNHYWFLFCRSTKPSVREGAVCGCTCSGNARLNLCTVADPCSFYFLITSLVSIWQSAWATLSVILFFSSTKPRFLFSCWSSMVCRRRPVWPEHVTEVPADQRSPGSRAAHQSERKMTRLMRRRRQIVTRAVLSSIIIISECWNEQDSDQQNGWILSPLGYYKWDDWVTVWHKGWMCGKQARFTSVGARMFEGHGWKKKEHQLNVQYTVRVL